MQQRQWRKVFGITGTATILASLLVIGRPVGVSASSAPVIDDATLEERT